MSQTSWLQDTLTAMRGHAQALISAQSADTDMAVFAGSVQAKTGDDSQLYYVDQEYDTSENGPGDKPNIHMAAGWHTMAELLKAVLSCNASHIQQCQTAYTAGQQQLSQRNQVLSAWFSSLNTLATSADSLSIQQANQCINAMVQYIMQTQNAI